MHAHFFLDPGHKVCGDVFIVIRIKNTINLQSINPEKNRLNPMSCFIEDDELTVLSYIHYTDDRGYIKFTIKKGQFVRLIC